MLQKRLNVEKVVDKVLTYVLGSAGLFLHVRPRWEMSVTKGQRDGSYIVFFS